MHCLYCATLRWRFVINSHSRRVHHTVACLKNNNKKLDGNVVSVDTFSIFCPAISSLAFSCPAISCFAFLCLANSCPGISCPAILTVRHFHVRHFQSTRGKLCVWTLLRTFCFFASDVCIAIFSMYCIYPQKNGQADCQPGWLIT